MNENMSDRDKKALALVALAANFGQEFPMSLYSIWLDELEAYTVSEVNKAVRELIRNYEYKTLPPFAVLKRILDKTTGRLSEEERITLMAEAEWCKMLDAVGKFGRMYEPEFCPTTGQVVRSLGGWGLVCEWRTDRLEWRRKEFVECWKRFYGHEERLELGAAGFEAQALETAERKMRELMAGLK